jgi:putative nucleotidyltransferase with HDIG domain
MMPISREAALKLLAKYNQDRHDYIHFFESEAIMRELASRLGEDVEYWGMLGLLHDVDWGITKHDSREHLTKAPEILRETGFDDAFIQAVLSHGYGWDCAGLKEKRREAKIEHALAASETITGLIHAYSLLRGNKVDGMKVSRLKKKFKDKNFAAGVNRAIILECEKLGISLDEFMQISIEAIKKIAKEVGLS